MGCLQNESSNVGYSPKKLFNCLHVLGCSKAWTALALAGLRLILFLWIVNLKNSQKILRKYIQGLILADIACILQRVSSDYLHYYRLYWTLQQYHQRNF